MHTLGVVHTFKAHIRKYPLPAHGPFARALFLRNHKVTALYEEKLEDYTF